MHFSNSLEEMQKLQVNCPKILCQDLFHNPDSEMFGEDGYLFKRQWFVGQICIR